MSTCNMHMCFTARPNIYGVIQHAESSSSVKILFRLSFICDMDY